MSETQTYDYAIAPHLYAILPAQSVEEEKGLLSGVSSINGSGRSGGGGSGGSGGGGGRLAELWNVVNGRVRETTVTMSGRGRKNSSLAPCHYPSFVLSASFTSIRRSG